MSAKNATNEIQYRKKITLDRLLTALFENAYGGWEMEHDDVLMVPCKILEQLGLAEIERVQTRRGKMTTVYYFCIASHELQVLVNRSGAIE